MIETMRAARAVTVTVTTIRRTGPRSRLEMELRAVAEDLAGCPDRDELTLDEEILVAEALDEAVAAAIPAVREVLDRELTPRIEALPIGTRLTLARARRRLEFGVD
jgi:hypothetical protein